MAVIYLDYHASAPTDPRAVAAMLPWLEHAANPHSAHAAGRHAAEAVGTARAHVAALIGADPREVIFTSGATEANNLALRGFAHRAGAGRVVTLATEHSSILETVRDLARQGVATAILPVLPDGSPDPAALRAALAGAALLSVMAVHNEFGLVQPIAALAAAAHAAGARFHTDAAQAAYTPIDVARDGIDLLSLSAHKLGGPQGIGALYIRRTPRTRLAPLFAGGGQERGLRPGTVPVALAVGFGEACRLLRAEREGEAARIAALRNRLHAGLAARIPGLALNGPAAPRHPGNLSLRFPGLRATALMDACPQLAVSAGSACHAAEAAPSPALLALGLSPEDAAGTLRLGVGRHTSTADIEAAIGTLAAAAANVRSLQSPCPV